MPSPVLAVLGRVAAGTNYVYQIAMGVILIVSLFKKARRNRG